MIRFNLLPALTANETNPALTVGLWDLLQHFPETVRWSFYGEYKERGAKMYPIVKLRRAEADKETKALLKRIGSDAVQHKRFGRQYARIAHYEPLTIFAISLHQLQSYENMVMPIVEAARYLQSFENDVMAYSILEALTSPSLERNKADGINVSDTLTGKAIAISMLERC